MLSLEVVLVFYVCVCVRNIYKGIIMVKLVVIRLIIKMCPMRIYCIYLSVYCFINCSVVLPTLIPICLSYNCKWWPRRCNYFGLFICSYQLYMWWAMSSPIIRSTWLYLQHLILSISIAAGWCHGWVGSHPWHQPAAIPVDNIRCCRWDGTQFHLIHDTSQQQFI